MKLVTVKDLVKSVAKRWKAQYFQAGYGWSTLWKDESSEAIYKAIKALKKPTVAQVNKIIGNSSWTHESCGECSNYSDKVVVFGNENESFVVCAACLRDAGKLIK